MVRLIFWFAVLIAVTFGVTWLADSPGGVSVVIQGDKYTVSLGVAVMALALLFVGIWIVWGVFKWLIGRPSAFGGFFSRRRERKGRQALSTGLVAIGAGDDATASKAAVTASRLLPDDPLAQLLSAQSAQQQGDSARVKQVYRDMTKADDTKLLGLRGLFTEARREKNIAAAREIAREALEVNAGVSWASNAMLVSYAADKDWPAVLLLLDNQVKAKIIDKETANRKKAVVLTAQAMAAEDADPEAALDLAMKAHKLDPALVPAALVAGRMQAAIGSLRKASRVLEKTWKLSPHPDIAQVYAHARPGDSARDRQARVNALLRTCHGGREGAIASAVAAIEAQDWQAAREALKPLVLDQPSVRVCTLMAEVETAETGDKGRAREWLARAVHAPRDPAWTTQGFVAPEWMPVSPVTGELGAFEWKVPLEGNAITDRQREEATARFLIADEPETAVAIEDIAPVAIDPDAEVMDAEVVVENTEEPQAIAAADAKPDDEQAKENDKESSAKEKPETTETPEKPPVTDKQPAKAGQAGPTDVKTHRIPDDPGPKKAGADKNGESWFG